MSTPSEGPASAIAAALTRIVADGFILRFHTEALRWNTGEDDLAYADFFEQSRPALDALILGAAARIHILGHRSPRSLEALRTLSSIPDGGKSNSSGKAVDLKRLSGEYRTLDRGCKLVAAIALRDRDQDTVHLLAQQTRTLAALLLRLDQLLVRTP